MGSTNASEGSDKQEADLTEPDTHGAADAATHAGSVIQRKTTMQPTNLGRRKKASWSQAPQWCWYTRAPRIQQLMKGAETKSVCAIAKDTPKAGFRLVESVVDSGAEESVAIPNVFPAEIVQAPCPKRWQVQSCELHWDSKSGPAKRSFPQR